MQNFPLSYKLIKVDFKRASWQDNQGGMRFMVSGDGQSYYEFYTGRWGGPFKLKKVTNGTLSWEEALTTFNFNDNVWYSLSLANDGDTLLWSVTNNKDNVTENGTIVDKEMFELRGGAAKYQITITGDSVVYFDNFSLNNIEPNAENYVSQKLIAADSFESYAVMAESQHSDVETIGSTWRSSPTYRGAGWAGYMGSQIVDYNGSKALRLVAGANGGSPYYRFKQYSCFKIQNYY